MILYRVTYTSIIDGETHIYMNIGFQTPEGAQDEIDRLVRDYEKRWAKHTDIEIVNMHLNGVRVVTAMIARDYKVVPVKCTPL